MIEKLLTQIESYNRNYDKKKIIQGFEICKKAHGKQMRKSGEPYYHHPFNVALEIAKLKLDDDCIVAAFLHDTLEDTTLRKSQISEMFSPTVAMIVDGVSKLDSIQLSVEDVKEAENLKKMFLAISKDIRVLIVKLCDRLDNMRTIKFHGNSQKIRQIAIETLEIYAPLAERIGLGSIANELQNLSFRAINPEKMSEIEKNIEIIKHRYGAHGISRIISNIEIALATRGLVINVITRYKSPYSIFRKLENTGLQIDDLSDIFGIRIVCRSIDDCYAALGVLHTNYKAIPGKFKDYISIPKGNGYKSIHTCILNDDGDYIEIQIRTIQMEEEANFGLAAHWSYKQNINQKEFLHQEYQDFIRNILKIFYQHNDAREILNLTKTEIMFDEIFVIDEQNGGIVNLQNGATVLDFTFSKYGDKVLFIDSALVNDKNYPLIAKLKDGDRVSIKFQDKITFQKNWLNSVVDAELKILFQNYIANNIQQENKNEVLRIIENFLNKRVNKSFKSEDAVDYIAQKYLQKHEIIYDWIKSGRIDIVKELENFHVIPDYKTSDQAEIQTIHKAHFVYHKCNICNPTDEEEKVYIPIPNSFVVCHAKNCSILTQDVFNNVLLDIN